MFKNIYIYLVEVLWREYTVLFDNLIAVSKNFISVPALSLVPKGGFINTVSKNLTNLKRVSK